VLLVEVILAGLFGLLIGSFLNVCIYRLPRDLSVIRPRSHCVECNQMVRAWDNIPVASYFLLRGKCRDCGARISWRYPVVELITGLLFAYFLWTDALTLLALRDCTFSALLVALFFTDLEERILPEQLTIGGIALGLLFSLVVPIGDGIGALFGLKGVWASLGDSVLGAGVPAFILWFIGFAWGKLFKVDALGLGDVIMLSEIGAFLGLRATMLTLIIAAMVGSMIGLIYVVIARKKLREFELPLGSFLSGAGILVTAFGAAIVHWYLSLSA
jgi:leader peptidase (prepilin peptidase)/N-methyltransferase